MGFHYEDVYSRCIFFCLIHNFLFINKRGNGTRKATPSINKPRLIMAKLSFETRKERREVVRALRQYHSRWANDIREGWNIGNTEAQGILYTLYGVCGEIILAMEYKMNGTGRDKMAMHLTRDRLERLVKSEVFNDYDILGMIHACGVITSGTKHHIRVMFECLDWLTTK